MRHRVVLAGTALLAAGLLTGCGSRIKLAGTDPMAPVGSKAKAAATPSASAAAAGGLFSSGLSGSLSAGSPAPAATRAGKAAKKPAAAGKSAAATTPAAPATTAAAPKTSAPVLSVPKVTKPVDPALPPVVIGTVSSASGPLAAYDTGVPSVVQAWANQVNAGGGLAGRKVTVVTADDGGNPAKALAAVKQLVTKKKVSAFVGSWMPLTGEAVRGYLEKADIPVIGGDLVSSAWTDSPVFFPQGTPLHANALAGLALAHGDPGGTTFGLLYCTDDPTCTAAYSQEITAGGAAAAGLKPVYSNGVPSNAPSYSGYCLAAQHANVAVLAIAAPLSTARAIASACLRAGYEPQFNYLSSPDGVGYSATGVSATPVTAPYGLFAPLPDVSWTVQDSPATKAFHALLDANHLTASSATEEAYISTQLFAAAMAKLGKATPTGGALIGALDGLAPDALAGLTPALHFTKGQPTPANPCYFGVEATLSGLQPLGSGTAICT